MSTLEKHSYDVIVIGAGGAGLRAAIEAREQGLRVAILCKSLFGKAHTVMAEGGIAASMGNVNSKDNWQVHFRDTMRGGKFLNNPRMAELHEHGDAEARLKVFAECTITDLPRTDGAVSGAMGYWRESGKFVVFEAPD